MSFVKTQTLGTQVRSQSSMNRNNIFCDLNHRNAAWKDGPQHGVSQTLSYLSTHYKTYHFVEKIQELTTAFSCQVRKLEVQ